MQSPFSLKRQRGIPSLNAHAKSFLSQNTTRDSFLECPCKVLSLSKYNAGFLPWRGGTAHFPFHVCRSALISATASVAATTPTAPTAPSSSIATSSSTVVATSSSTVTSAATIASAAAAAAATTTTIVVSSSPAPAASAVV